MPNQRVFKVWLQPDGSKIKRAGKNFHLSIFAALLFLLSFFSAAQAQENEIKIGVLAFRGNADVQKRWTATAEYLSAHIPEYHFTIVPLDFEEIYEAVENEEVDFVLTNSGIYVELEYLYGIDRIATMKNMWQGQGFNQFGGVIFTKANRENINTFDDLRNKSFMAVDEVSFGGWLMAHREFLSRGLDPYTDFASLRFGGTHDEVVYAVQNQLVDAGTVRTGILERMEQEGKIKLSDFKVLNPQKSKDFGLLLSTRLYPEWPFARVSRKSDGLAEKISIALLSMSSDDEAAKSAGIMGWSIPYEYQAVHECLRELHLSPYDQVEGVTEAELIFQYRYWIEFMLLGLAGLVLGTLYALRLNRRLNLKTSELEEARNELEERVQERTLALQETNQKLQEENLVRQRAESKLRKSEERYRSIYERIDDVIYETDFYGILTGITPSIEKHSSYKPEEVIGKSVREFYADDDEYGVLWDAMKRTGFVRDFEIKMKRKNGDILIASVSAHVVYDEEGNPFKTEGVLRDVTTQVRAKEAIQRQASRLNSLRIIDKAISGSLDLKITLDVLIEQLIGQLNVDAATVLTYHKEILTLSLADSYGFKTNALQPKSLPLGEGLAGKVALAKQEIYMPNLRDEDKHPVEVEHLVEEGFSFYYGLPLVAKGLLIGVLEIFHRAALEPDDDWLDYAKTLAGQAAIAMDNISLFNDLEQSNIKLVRAYDATIEGWAQALELRDMEAEGHSRRVVQMTMELAQRMGVDAEKLVHIRRGALLHDIGKMGIPDHILKKAGPLTDDEWQIMRKHPVFAYEWLSPIEYLRSALDIPYCHHEKWDGTGYPRGLRGTQIPIEARIFSVADVWDALRSDRQYRKSRSREDVIEHIKERSGTRFDPQVVAAFLAYIEEKM